MKKLMLAIVFLMGLFINNSFAQDTMAKDQHGHNHSIAKSEVQTIQLNQIKGDFTVKGITLSEGTYIFEISNTGVDHEVGFVIAPKGKTDQEHHIKEGYVQKTIKDGETSNSKAVTLAKGEYVYFCPLNPTPQYTITVE